MPSKYIGVFSADLLITTKYSDIIKKKGVDDHDVPYNVRSYRIRNLVF